MAKKVNKENAVNEILILLNAGKTYSEIMKVFKSKWGLSDSTFLRYYNSANKIYLSQIAEIRNELKELRMAQEVEQIEKAILSRLERLEIASSVARGKEVETSEGFIYPSFSDRLKALDYISKVEKDYKEVTDVNVNIERPLFCSCQEPRILTKQEMKDNKEQIEKVIDKLDEDY